MADFNLFLMLDLDPAAPWDKAAFDRSLQKKQALWSADADHPNQKKKNEARHNIQLIPQLIAVAADEQRRTEQAAEARNAAEARRKALSRELERDLKWLQVKGYLTPKQLADLEKQYVPAVISQEALKRRLHVPVQAKPAIEAESGPAVLDPSKARKIQDDLDEVSKSDLYDFLELDRNSALHVLREKADDLYTRSQKNVNKTAKVEAQSRLAGECRDLFKTDEGRARYDATVDDARFDGMRDAANKMAGEANMLSAAAVQMLVDEFLSAGGARVVQRGIATLRSHAAKRGWVVELPPGMLEARTCGNGHVVTGTPAAEARCRECGVPLFEDCPRCPERKIASDQRACPSCEFPLGNRSHVQKECDKADTLCAQMRFKEAGQHSAQAAAAWPQATRGELQVRIAALQKQISEGLAGQRGQLQEVQQALQQRRFYLARDLLLDAARVFPLHAPELAADRAAADSGISRAQAALTRARNLPDAGSRADAYLDVLEIAVDCQEALDALEATPPEPPASLQASVAGREVHLQWQARPARLTAYVLLRRASSPQSSATLIPVQGMSHADASPEAGVPLYYTVYAVRGNTRSSKGAELREPVYVLDEIRDLQIRPGDGEVSLTWEKPAGAATVIVRRSKGSAPRTATEGVSVPVASDGASARDRDGLENGQVYEYTVFTRLSLPGGRVMISHGTRKTATPVEPPAPIQELVFSRMPGGSERLQVSWTAPTRGEVRVFPGSQSFQLRAGEQRTLEELIQRFGQPLRGGPVSVEDTLSTQGVRYYLPVTVVHGSATIGQEHAYRNMADCTHLESEIRGDRVRLRWKWPPGCTQVLIGCSPRGYVTEKEATPLSLLQYGGQTHGHHDIVNLGHDDLHVVIYAQYGAAGRPMLSSTGYRKLVLVKSRMMISYEILKHILWGTLKLKVRVLKGEGRFPALILVRSERKLPARKTDGVRILEVPRDTPREEREFRIPDQIRSESAYGKLFLADDEDLDRVTLQHPPEESLRLY
jgi:hypothetical protein